MVVTDSNQIHWREGLLDPVSAIREQSIASLIAEPERDAMPHLERCLDDTELNVKHLAVIALGAYGSEAVQSLARALDSRFIVSTRIAAANGLARIGEESAPAAEALRACLYDANPDLRWHAAFALSRIKKPAVSLLQREIDASRPIVAALAVQSLGWIGSDAKDSVDSIERLSKEADPKLQMHCLTAMAKITEDAETSLPVLIELTQDPSHQVSAVIRIGELGELGSDARDALVDCLSSDNHECRCEAILALARIKANDDETVELLGGIQSTEQGKTSKLAKAALASFEAKEQ